MTDIPVIVISSARAGAGKTTLALNLAAVLWQDNHEVFLFSGETGGFSDFLDKRRKLKKTNLPMPQLIDDLAKAVPDKNKKQVIIAEIPSEQNDKYTSVFAQAHTLITVAADKEDINWPLSHPYINLIWNAKKDIAARGIKYLNWIVVANNKQEQTEDFSALVEQQAKRYGFRISETLRYREAYRRIGEGFCAADMMDKKSDFNVTMADVYARREILTLTDFLWQNK